MKSLIVAIVLLFGAAGGVFAQAQLGAEPEFSPSSAASWGRGQSGVATAHGFESLWKNPAAFAGSTGSFTLLSLAPTLYLPPDPSVFEALGNLPQDPAGALATLEPYFASNGIGAGTTVGLGYTGHGLGLGLLDSTDLYGDSTQAVSGSVDAVSTLAFVGGLGFTLGKHLSLGGAVRPMFRIRAPGASLTELVDSVAVGPLSASSIPVLYGYGVALDFGLLWQSGPLAVGIAVKDIAGTRFYYSQDSLGDLFTALGSGQGLPPGRAASSAQYVVPMNADAGVSFHPNLGAFGAYFDPELEVDYHYVYGQDLSPPSLVAGVRAGARVRLLSFLTARAGYDAGYFTFGAGLKLSFLSINAALFTRPGGSEGALPNTGLAADITIEF